MFMLQCDNVFAVAKTHGYHDETSLVIYVSHTYLLGVEDKSPNRQET